MAYSQIPLIIGLAGKNNVISCTYRKSPLATGVLGLLTLSRSLDWYRLRKAQLPPSYCGTSEFVSFLDSRSGSRFKGVRALGFGERKVSTPLTVRSNSYKGGFAHELKEENYLRWVGSTYRTTSPGTMLIRGLV